MTATTRRSRGRGRRGGRRGRRRRLARLLLWTAAGLVAASALPVAVLRFAPPPTTAFILRSDARPVAYRFVPWPRISPHLAVAVLAAEDQRFLQHRGFDLHSIGDALEERVRGGRLRGASTLSQQVAKNLFLWPGRSLLRKGLEAWFTVWIELLWPKRRILEVYLNVAQFGDGIFGAAEASERFFGVAAWRLRPDEAALLAAVLPNPLRLRADAPSDYVRERAWEIQETAARLGGPAWLRGL